MKKHQDQESKWETESQKVETLQDFAENWKTKLQTATSQDNANTFNLLHLITEKSKSECQTTTGQDKK
jgi:hypothetical protein